MSKLLTLLQKTEKYVIGLMSGTSIDGIDAALLRIQGYGLQTKWELLAFEIFHYPAVLRQQLLDMATAVEWHADQFCRTNFLVAEYFAQAVKNLCQHAHLPLDQIDLIGSHGQTLRHLPNPVLQADYTIRATLQIGEPAVIAKRCGVVTVGDFRPADVALAGNGAPLVPYCDFLLLRSETQHRGVLNIGGIANLTWLNRGCKLNTVLAFDTGPGNMLLDGLMQKLFHQAYDHHGQMANSGQVHTGLLSHFLAHPYFKRLPPKSTGREEFGAGFIQAWLQKSEDLAISAPDVMATATELVAVTIFHAATRLISTCLPLDLLIVSGGGANNITLIRRLQHYFKMTVVQSSAAWGIPVDAKEAICFAILANETIHGIPNNVPTATGAGAPTVLGKICL